MKSILGTEADTVLLARSATTDKVPGGKTVMMGIHHAIIAKVVRRGKLRRMLQSLRADGVATRDDNESMWEIRSLRPSSLCQRI